MLGTPLERAYPAEHAGLQDEIAAHHLVVSPFAPGTAVTRASFPARNRVMAALCDASIIVEATERSGTKHQAEACLRHHRDLFLCASLVANRRVRWPLRLAGPRTHVLTSTDQVLQCLRRRAAA